MKKILPWVAGLLILIVSFGTIYTTVQQSQRSAANNPQIQLAEDAAQALNRGDDGLSQVYGHVDIAHSLAPFTIIYDQKGQVDSASGYLNGKVPKIDLGVLKASKGKEYNAVTWQPQKGVRIAAVSVAAQKYYVLSGRSLREVEKNESNTLQLSLIGGLISALLLGIAFVVTKITDDL